MVTKHLLCALVLFLLPLVPARSAPPDGTPILDAAQDGQGQVWGVGTNLSSRLLRWQGNGWVEAPIPFAQGCDPLALARSDNGRVYCAWQKQGDADCLITVHQGALSRLVGHFTGPLMRENGTVLYPNLFADRDGTVWVTAQASRVWRIAPNGKARAFPLPNAWFFSKRTPKAQDDYFDPTFSLEDSRGRRWFWSDDLAIDMQAACLRGVLVWDGTALVHRATLPGVPDKPLSMLAAEDAGHLLAGVMDGGLYRLDTETRQGRLVPPPAPRAFQYVETMFQTGSDWYLADLSATKNARSAVLWRRHVGSNRWEKIVSGLDLNLDQGDQPRRPWLASEQGLWVGALGGGAWWIPTRGAAIPVDWRRGFPLTNMNRLFRLRDGRLLAISESEAAATLGPVPGSLHADPQIETFVSSPAAPQLVADDAHHQWAFLAGDTRLLREWDGQAWVRHPIPRTVNFSKVTVLARDSQGRLWLLPTDYNGPAAVFAPATGTWTVFPTCEAAFAAQSGLPAFALRAPSHQAMPQFGARGRIGFLTDEQTIHYFNGRSWQHWDVAKIVGVKGASDMSPPFFDRVGNVCFNWQNRGWEWTGAGGWRNIACEPLPGANAPSSFGPPDKSALPPGSPAGRATSLVKDGSNGVWLSANRQLYKVAFGLAAPQFPSHSGNPFLDGRTITGLERDSRGNLFLSTNPSWYNEIVLVRTRPARPVRVATAAMAPDAVRLTLTASEPGPHLFVWRLDGGPWSAATHDGRVLLDFLPGGPHSVEALALDARLRFDPTPILATFTVKADPTQQVQALVTLLLTGRDAAREKAVSHLRRFPALAPPALQAARARADEDQRWWIDATLQQLAADGMPADGAKETAPKT